MHACLAAPRSASITPTEFVHGMKRAALKFPVDPTIAARGTPNASHLEYLTLLTESLNATIKNLCKALFEHMTHAQADAGAAMQRVQAQVYAARQAAGLPSNVPPMVAPASVSEQLMFAQQQVRAHMHARARARRKPRAHGWPSAASPQAPAAASAPRAAACAHDVLTVTRIRRACASSQMAELHQAFVDHPGKRARI